MRRRPDGTGSRPGPGAGQISGDPDDGGERRGDGGDEPPPPPSASRPAPVAPPGARDRAPLTGRAGQTASA
ncbi:hypothetical protein NGM37_05750, partial [Streptomyces sp. TRM76130]|nr:hypothetical protein [Streptomyces sp. TRM76130]